MYRYVTCIKIESGYFDVAFIFCKHYDTVSFISSTDFAIDVYLDVVIKVSHDLWQSMPVFFSLISSSKLKGGTSTS